MTLEEAQQIANICATADGGCEVCVGSLRRQLAKTFPEFIWTYATRTDEEIELLEEQNGFDYVPTRYLHVEMAGE